MKNTQILYFDTQTGIFKKTVMNITGIKEGELMHLKCSDGRKILVNRKQLLMVEIIPPEMVENTFGSLANTYCANTEEWHE